MTQKLYRSEGLTREARKRSELGDAAAQEEDINEKSPKQKLLQRRKIVRSKRIL